MTREVYRDAAGNTAERVRYTLPDRDVLVLRHANGRLLGYGFGSGEVPAGGCPEQTRAGLAAFGFDLDSAVLVPSTS